MNTVHCPRGHKVLGNNCLECLRARLEELEQRTKQFQQDLGDMESVLHGNRIVQEIDILKHIKSDI